VSWRFAIRPTWIVRHVAVVVLVVVMVLLGLWQLRRLDEKREIKATTEARQELPVEPVETVVPSGAAVGDAALDAVEHRRVTATGEYADDDTFVVENRTYNSASGAWVLTPLVLDDGRAVVVNRGFLGYDQAGDIVPPPAPAGPVAVEGILLTSEQRGRFGASDPEGEGLQVLARVDLERVATRIEDEVVPAYIQRITSDPEEVAPVAGAASLVALGAPEPSEGPHLSYAVQWFTFTTIAVIGYAVLLRRVAHDQAKEEAAAAADAALDRELADLLEQGT
jgi:surfeit locus 1 family protein